MIKQTDWLLKRMGAGGCITIVTATSRFYCLFFLIVIPMFLMCRLKILTKYSVLQNLTWIVELQWLEHLCKHEKIFETGVVRTDKC